MGDPIYGRRDKLFPEATLMLHAYRLAVRVPVEGKRGEASGQGAATEEPRDESASVKAPGHGELREFQAPLPDRIRRTLRALSARERRLGSS
jgi:23S rRNA-/tRNA-specific pseudouridylate synthase